jgi:hypothetical protein
MTATYWEVGRRIVKFEQGGEWSDTSPGQLEDLAGQQRASFPQSGTRHFFRILFSLP